MKHFTKLSLFFFLITFTHFVSAQNKMESLSISNAVYYELIGRYDIARLNHILNVEIPAATGTK
jgi:hypothetical protein